MPLTHFVMFVVDSVRDVVAKDDRNIFSGQHSRYLWHDLR